MIRYRIQYYPGLALGFSHSIQLVTRAKAASLNLLLAGMVTMVNFRSVTVHIMVEQVSFQMALINSILGVLVYGLAGNQNILILQRIDQ